MAQYWIITISCLIFAGLSEGKVEDLSFHPGPAVEDLTLPPGLAIGVATAAYQVEGGWNVSGKGESIWDRMVHERPDIIVDGTNGDIACDSFHRFEEDVQHMKSIGIQFYRFSISWTRIMKPGFAHEINKAGLQYYKNLLRLLKESNIQPIVTIYHWDHPQYIEDMGGWINELILEYFVFYARTLFRELGDCVKIWQTVNEPNIYCTSAYSGADFRSLAPAKALNTSGTYLCMHNVLKAHALVYHVYDKEFRPTQHGQIGIGPHCINFLAADPNDTETPERALQFFCGWVYHPIYKGDYPEIMKKRVAMISKAEGYEKSRLPEFSEEWIRKIKGSADYLGLNHYTSVLVTPDPDEKRGIYNSDNGVIESYDPRWPNSSAKWLKDVPWGLRDQLIWIKKEYNNPAVRIMENGWSDEGGLHDYGRINYYYGYVKSLLQAIKEDHCNVQSYSMWSILDNFEWDEGYTEKFGIVSVDFNHPDRTRRNKLSAEWWKTVLKTRQLQPVPRRPRS